MMRRIALAMLVFCACRSTVQSARVRGPDGEDNWVAITCKGSQMRCVQRAGEACPRGYVVAGRLGREGFEAGGFASGGNSGGVAMARARSTYDGEMLVKCKGAPSEEPAAPTRFRECMSDEGCDTGDECLFADSDSFSSHGRCRPRRRH